MSTVTVEVETRGSFAMHTLNRPRRSNTLRLQMGMDLLAAAVTRTSDPAVRAVVRAGAGRNFCCSEDLRGLMDKGAAAPGTRRAMALVLLNRAKYQPVFP
jgi:enoyl-CoA hydratase/carnithine racemase